MELRSEVHIVRFKVAVYIRFGLIVTTIQPFKSESLLRIMYIRIPFLSHRKRYISATKINRLMLFTIQSLLFVRNVMKHTNMLCEQNADHTNMLKRVVYTETAWL
jgi:hypothetical protein